MRDNEQTISRFTRLFGAAMRPHGARVERYRAADKVWHGVLEASKSRWESDLHPAYALQIAETYLSNLVVDLPRQRVHPRTRAGEESAPKLERLVRYQHQQDHFDEKWAAFCQQAVIRPLTAAKIAWRQEIRKVRRRQFKVIIPPGGPIDPVTIDDPDADAEWEATIIADQPTMTVIDVTQLLWDPGATSLDEAAYVMWRDYVTVSELRDMGDAGIYQNVDQVEACDRLPTLDGDEERDLRGRVEVVEWWDRTDNRLVVVANRSVVLRDEPNPLGHAELPFVVATVIPVPFSIVGKSIVELCADHQAALWDLQNQRIDNTRFISNAVWRIDPSLESKVTEIHPGLLIPAREGNIESLAPDTSIIAPLLQAEQSVRQDMADLTGVTPYVSGTSSMQVDQTTATGISLMQNQAQQRIIMGRQRLMGALSRIGRQWIMLNQQLLPPGTAVRVTDSPDGGWLQVDPSAIQMAFDFEVENVVESMNQQQKRTEALTRLQVLVGVQPVLAANPAGPQLDVPALVQDVTEAFDERPEKYLTAPNPATLAPTQGPVPPGMPGGLAAPMAAPAGPPPPAGAGAPA